MPNALILKILRNLPFRGLAERFDDSPIDSPARLAHFVRTRSSFIGQTTLYGYLKTRMGTRYRYMFADDVFAHSLRIAAAQVFASCLADLTIYCIARVVRDGGLAETEAQAFAEWIYAEGFEQGLRDISAKNRPDGALQRFQARIATLQWDKVGTGLEEFDPSGEDLVRFAPVIDAFKELDGEIVKNSIHLKWGNVREQWERRVRPGDLAEGWSARNAA